MSESSILQNQIDLLFVEFLKIYVQFQNCIEFQDQVWMRFISRSNQIWKFMMCNLKVEVFI